MHDQVDLPARPAQYLPVPDRLQESVGKLLQSRFSAGLYSHQTEAIATAIDGKNVCLATSTASGKSLVFMAIAAHLTQQQRDTRVLALYPARALIQDQKRKWEAMLRPLEISLGFIDGGVAMGARSDILRSSRVVLMTPDVAHAWLMSRLDQETVRDFVAHLRLLILDEAHVYDGVFGTNMAYLLRRLRAASGPLQIISSTATVGSADSFIRELTGERARVFGPEDDGSGAPLRTVLLARPPATRGFESTAGLLRDLAQLDQGRFLAFGDSRAMVEQLVAASHRAVEEADEDDGEIEDSEDGDACLPSQRRHRILPYRAGYESDDREQIQAALESGDLAGVVSTSAMELGLDIGAIDITVLLSVPASAKAFWQRLGRAGRTRAGVCLLIDTQGTLADSPSGLTAYMRRPPEPNWLYLQNRYIQYANALCAATELRALGRTQAHVAAFDSLPASFRAFLDNELNPSEMIAPDLYPLKQQAEGGPHREFPLRSSNEKTFQVKGPHGLRLGSVMFRELMREAYPGAVYYYMARPYRVYRYHYQAGEAVTRREKHRTTRPIMQAMVFPRFQGGMLNLWRANGGFVAEVELQVSERVLGFTERRGSVKEEHRYGPGSPYSQRELNRFFQTTGVCWSFPTQAGCSETIGLLMLQACCNVLGIQPRDLGVGPFHAKASPLGVGKCQGLCIFDATSGSLRLTQRLAERFAEVVAAAAALASPDDQPNVRDELSRLVELAKTLQPEAISGPSRHVSIDPSCVEVIAPGQRAMLRSGSETGQVEVLAYRYTPQGLMYELVPQHAGVKWMVAANQLEPLYGETAMIRVNLTTGETEMAA